MDTEPHSLKSYVLGKRGLIGISASNETTRLERVERVARTLLDNSTQLPLAIHDYKGTLAVLWSMTPTPLAMHRVEAAWEEESEIAVQHYLLRSIDHWVAWQNPFAENV